MQWVSINDVAFPIAPNLFLVAMDTFMNNAACKFMLPIAPFLSLVAMDTIMNNAGSKYQ